MDLRTASEAALKLSLEGPFGWPVTFTDPATDLEQTVNAQVTRVDSLIDPQTGARVYAPHTAVTVRLSSMTPIPDEGWPITTTDITGSTVSGVCRDLVYDHTLGTMTVMIEELESAS